MGLAMAWSHAGRRHLLIRRRYRSQAHSELRGILIDALVGGAVITPEGVAYKIAGVTAEDAAVEAGVIAEEGAAVAEEIVAADEKAAEADEPASTVGSDA